MGGKITPRLKRPDGNQGALELSGLCIRAQSNGTRGVPMSAGNFVFEGDCLPPQFSPSRECIAMPTAIIDGYIAEGFALIADGLSTDPETKVPRRKNNQKVFPAGGSGRMLAYALYGTAKISGRYGPHPALDLSDEAQQAVMELVNYDPADLLTYATEVCGRLQKRLAEWKGRIEYPCTAPDLGNPGQFVILQVFFRGFYRGAPAKVDVKIVHKDGAVAIEAFSLPLRIGFMTVGSQKVHDALLTRLYFDPSLAAFRIPAMEKNDDDLTLDDIISVAASYIRACESEAGRKIDPDIAPTIGGRVHAVTITMRDGARWAEGYAHPNGEIGIPILHAASNSLSSQT